MSDNKLDILVLMRETCDPRPPARLTADGYGIRDRGLRRIANPADLCALEQALTLAEASGGRVTAVAVGPERLADHLRLALARGAGRAVRVWNPAFEDGDAVSEARVVQRIIEILRPDIIFSGDALLDGGDDPVPALAAANLDLPYIMAAVDLKHEGDKVEILRKSDRGARQRVAAAMPCAVFFQDGCAEVRYPGHDALTSALGAEIESWGIAELGLPLLELGASGAVLGKDKCRFPRFNPQRVVTPDAELPAFDRVMALLSGGIKQREGKVHSGSPEAAVETLLNIFKAEGLIGGSGK